MERARLLANGICRLVNRLVFGWFEMGCFLLALVPILRMSMIVADTGAEVPSNDMLLTIDLIDAVLDGRYDWTNYFKDTFLVGSHSIAVPVLIRLAFVTLTDWNIACELWFSFSLSLAKLYLLVRLFQIPTTPDQSWKNAVLWPILSLAIFSTSQTDLYTFSESGLGFQPLHLGLLIALHGIFSRSGRTSGAWLVAGGGLVACYCCGAAPPFWPIALVAMFLVGYRSWLHYAIVLTGLVLGCWPYVFYKYCCPNTSHFQESQGLWFSPWVWTKALGWPLARGFDSEIALLHGVFGILGALTALLGWTRRLTIKQAHSFGPAVVVLVYSLVLIFTIVKFRGESFAPWYSCHFIFFWFGVIGIFHALWASPTPPQTRAIDSSLTTASLVGLGIIATLFIQTNFTYTDKAFYLNGRGPAAASVMREFRNAPPGTERFVFQWGNPTQAQLHQLGSCIEKHRLSTFAPNQIWSLQGDVAIDKVFVEECSPPIFWRGQTPNPIPFHDYHRLNLYTHPPTKVCWQITLPKDLSSVQLRTAATISSEAPWEGADGVRAFLYLEEKTGSRRLLWEHRLGTRRKHWSQCNVSLDPWIGQTVTLHFESDSLGNPSYDWLLWRFPHLLVHRPK
jgi:hypothetical protein